MKSTLPTTAKFDVPYLKETLTDLFGDISGTPEIISMTGDASDRRYFRVSFNNADVKPGSIVIMQLSSPIANGDNDFIQISRYLQNLKLRVPRIHKIDAEKGLLHLEDCGDETLSDRLLSTPHELEKLYSKAIAELVELQTRAHNAPFTRRFDVEKLMWEMEFMLTHYIEGLLKTPLSPKQRNNWTQELLPLCQLLSEQPLYFVHRDFHSRNLMVHNNELIWIDFQDARLGPCQYDLASLLRDSYVTLDEPFRIKMIDLFLELHSAQGNLFVREDFLKIFDWMSIQRNLKAIGTFSFQKCEKNSDRYLQYIAPTLNYVHQALGRRPELSGLSRLLQDFTPV
jgi:N-acetylmuramate 1-kinase